MATEGRWGFFDMVPVEPGAMDIVTAGHKAVAAERPDEPDDTAIATPAPRTIALPPCRVQAPDILILDVVNGRHDSGQTIRDAPRTTTRPVGANRNQVLANRIQSAILAEHLMNFDIEIEVRDGVAKLVGTVASEQHRAAAERAAASVSGISRVENHLTVVDTDS